MRSRLASSRVPTPPGFLPRGRTGCSDREPACLRRRPGITQPHDSPRYGAALHASETAPIQSPYPARSSGTFAGALSGAGGVRVRLRDHDRGRRRPPTRPPVTEARAAVRNRTPVRDHQRGVSWVCCKGACGLTGAAARGAMGEPRRNRRRRAIHWGPPRRKGMSSTNESRPKSRLADRWMRRPVLGRATLRPQVEDGVEAGRARSRPRRSTTANRIFGIDSSHHEPRWRPGRGG